MEKTSEFSFILKASEHGVGVFAAQPIEKGAYLRLFGDNETDDLESLSRPKEEVPASFQEYCIDRGDTLICPQDFGHMHLGWYLNHSKNPNAARDADLKWYALRDIALGEEIVIDYNSLEEPNAARESYYN